MYIKVGKLHYGNLNHGVSGTLNCEREQFFYGRQMLWDLTGLNLLIIERRLPEKLFY
jgi:hypothetical protein